eukprot:3411985-Amphidinium_carterae.1
MRSRGKSSTSNRIRRIRPITTRTQLGLKSCPDAYKRRFWSTRGKNSRTQHSFREGDLVDSMHSEGWEGEELDVTKGVKSHGRMNDL